MEINVWVPGETISWSAKQALTNQNYSPLEC